MKRAVITGATGAIGMALIDELTKHGIRVTVIGHRGSKRLSQISSGRAVVLECDLKDYASLSAADFPEDGYDAFFHLAWDGAFGAGRNDMYLQTENIRCSLEAVSLAHRLGCSVFVGAGSQAEYGRVEGLLSEAVPARPENGYGMAKLCAGQMTRLLCGTYGIRHIWTRILSVYGPYDGAGSMVMSALQRLCAGETAEFTKGEQQWDYLYSQDAARALLALAQKGIHGKVYCLGSGKSRPLKEYIEAIRHEADPAGRITLGALPYPPGQVMHLCADITLLTEDTGFTPQTTFEEGIRQTCRWYLKQKKHTGEKDTKEGRKTE